MSHSNEYRRRTNQIIALAFAALLLGLALAIVIDDGQRRLRPTPPPETTNTSEVVPAIFVKAISTEVNVVESN